MKGALRLAAAVLLPCCTAAAAELSPELWDRPRSAAAVMAQDAVRQAVADYHVRPLSRMVIVHGGRQDAQLQAEELRAWLVALAVDSRRLSLRADSTVASLRIEVVD